MDFDQSATTKFKQGLLQFFKEFTGNLGARLIIIEQTGQRGVADDIRAVTKEIHTKALKMAERIIEDWDDQSLAALCVYFQDLCKYINSMHDIEAKALKTLKLLQERLSAKDISIDVINDAVIAHKNTLQNTEKLLANVKPLKDMEAQIPSFTWLVASLHKKPEFASFLDKELSNKRELLFEDLQIRQALKAKL
jgi:hypothetical protein